MALDENADGRFDDLKNDTIIIDLNQDGKLEGSSDSAEWYQLSRPFNVNGKVWEAVSMSPDGRKLTLRPSAAKVALKAYLNPGCPAPSFTGKGVDEKPIDLKEAANGTQYVLLDFWASWCGPCRGEFPVLRRLHARYKDHGLRVIGINLDNDRKKAVDAAAEAVLDYPHVFDGRGWGNAVAELYRVHGIPQTYLLDKDLKIVAKNLRGKMLEDRLEALLGPGDKEAVAALEKKMAARAAARKAGSSTTGAVRDPKATFSDTLSIYLAGNGRQRGVNQADGHGKVLSSVDLPDFPYGIATCKDGLVAALPRAGKAIQIDNRGKVTTLYEGKLLRAPISIAVAAASNDVLVADNNLDTILLLPAKNRGAPVVLQQIHGAEQQLQNMSLAVTKDGFALLGTDKPDGIYRFLPKDGASLGEPVVAGDGHVAADPTSDKWVVCQRDGLHCFDRDHESFTIPYPAGKTDFRGGMAAFGPDGSLLVAFHQGEAGEIAQVDLKEKAFRTLFTWHGGRLTGLAVGPKMDWPATPPQP
jgi:thiol-disulfide isomerase/thioredoxin